jgi:hypothetical protein
VLTPVSHHPSDKLELKKREDRPDLLSSQHESGNMSQAT